MRKASSGIRAYLTPPKEEKVLPQSQAVVTNEDGDDKLEKTKKQSENGATGGKRVLNKIPFDVGIAVLAVLVYVLSNYVFHCTYLGAEAYSSPSIILQSRRSDGTRIIIDDYREAYYWLKRNTKSNAKILSWWDYGYQITGMANRTVLVDNNTWNNTHIATVGLTLGSEEEVAYKVARSLDANYILVIFGGHAGHRSDDISKFLWMIRIAAGVFPQIKEKDYYGSGRYRIDQGGSDIMKNCLMYKLCYYNFDKVKTRNNQPLGYDTVRNAEIGHKGFKLTRFREAYTTERWIVRIYEVLPLPNMDPKLVSTRSTKAATNAELSGSVAHKKIGKPSL